MKKITSLILVILVFFASIQVNCKALAQDSIVDVNSMMATIENLSATPRGVENKEIELARDFIKSEFEKYGLDITTQEFETPHTDWEGNKYMGVNIIGTLNPNTSRKTDDILIIGAHYDGISNVPAANDNASGVAVMLELLRLLHNVQTDTEIRFIAFDAEENGLNGSTYYVNYLKEDVIDNIIGMLNFDMLAAKKERSVKIYSADGNENYLSEILRRNENYSIVDVYSYSWGRSDHVPFFSKSIPILFFSHPPVNEEYHTMKDGIDKISPDMLKYAADAGQVIVKDIMSDKTPSFKSVSKPEIGDKVYEIGKNTYIPMYGKDIIEKATGIKFNQVKSDELTAEYRAKVKLFGMNETFTLTLSEPLGSIWVGEISVDMVGSGVSLEKLSTALTECYGNPIEETENGFLIYKWNNIYGNSYTIHKDDGNSFTFDIQPYNDGIQEGYILVNGELVRMEEPTGYINVNWTKKDGKIIRDEKVNKPSNILGVTNYAKQSWERMKEYMSDDEISRIINIYVGSDGIGGEFSISLEEHAESELIYLYTYDYAMEQLSEGNSMGVGYPMEGIHISLDYIDITNPLGNSYSDEDLRKNVGIARAKFHGGPNSPSDWAMNEVVKAIESNILPITLQTEYQKNITREDFCTLILTMLESTKTKIIIDKPTETKSLFTDTNNISVLTLFNLGIIKGESETKFSPLSEITREEATTILNRTYDFLKLGVHKPSGYTFTDDWQISDYAKESIYNMQTVKIIKGLGNDVFAPKDKYTREQAILTMVRLYDMMLNLK